MKIPRFLIFSALALATLGLSSCVVDEGYASGGGYAVVERPYVVQRSYYRDSGYGQGYRQHHRSYDGNYRHSGIRVQSPRSALHNALFY